MMRFIIWVNIDNNKIVFPVSCRKLSLIFFCVLAGIQFLIPFKPSQNLDQRSHSGVGWQWMNTIPYLYKFFFFPSSAFHTHTRFINISKTQCASWIFSTPIPFSQQQVCRVWRRRLVVNVAAYRNETNDKSCW